MKFLHHVGLVICSGLLRFLLFFGIGLVCAIFLFGNSKELKRVLSDNKVYAKFVDSIIEDNRKSQANSSIPLNDPHVVEIINQAFPPELLQDNTEKVIDSTYAWLNGKTPEPTFNVDLTPARQQLADNLSTYAFDTLRTKPVCFAVPKELDPFTAGCQPPNTDLGKEQRDLSTSMAGPEGILPKATFTAKDLPKDSSGKLITERYSFAPTVFKWAIFVPWIVGGLLILTMTGIVLLNRTKRIGFQQVGYSLMSTGAALLITPVLLLYVIPRFSKSLQFNQEGSATQRVMNSAAGQLNQDFNAILINISVQVIFLGVLVLLVERFTRPSSLYLELEKKAGVISSHKRKPSDAKRKYKPDTIPLQSSEESKRRKPKRTKNKKYRKIPKKEI